jgi:hypothetical protein
VCGSAAPRSRSGAPRGSRTAPVSLAPMDGVDPADLFDLLGGLDVEVDDDRLLIASHQHALQGFVRTGIDLLSRRNRMRSAPVRNGFGVPAG